MLAFLMITLLALLFTVLAVYFGRKEAREGDLGIDYDALREAEESLRP